MGIEKLITMKERSNTPNDYNTLYPITLAEQLIGILPIAKGGTGRTNLEDFASDLNAIGIAKIATGSYVGTGTFGVSNKNILTFDFEPKMVIIRANVASYYEMDGGAPWVNPNTHGSSVLIVGTAFYECTLEWEENTLSWYNNANAQQQLNKSGVTYYYIVVG